MVSKRLTKQEAREDRVAVAATQAYEYARRNARWVLGAIVVLVIAMIVAMLVAKGRVRAEQQAASAVAQAQALYANGDFAQAATQFQSLADRYGSTRSARLARLYEGNAELAAGNAAAAEQAFRRFLAHGTSDPLAESAAHRGLGGSLAGQGKMAEAGAEYQKAAEIPGNLMAADDWLNAGRAYAQAGNKADAAHAFQTLIQEYPQSSSIAEARERLHETLDR